MGNSQKLHQLVRILNDSNENRNSEGSHETLYYNERSGEYENSRPSRFISLIGKYIAIEISQEKSVTLEIPTYRIDNPRTQAKIRLDIICYVRLFDKLKVQAADWMRKNPSSDNAFHEILQKGIAHFIKQNPDLQKENYLEHEPKLKQQLMDQIKAIGFDAEIDIKAIVEGALPQDAFKMIKKPITCIIRDGQIVVVCTLAMELKEPGKFMFANIKDLSEHFEKFLTHLLQSSFLKKSYAEVLQSFLDNSLQSELEEPVTKEASRIGYKVANLFSIPQLEDFDCKGPFELTTDSKGNVLEGIEFATSADQVKVRIKVVLRGSIHSFRGAIENHLRPGVKLKDLMQKEMIEHMRLFMGRTRPERFFLYFSHPNPKVGGLSLSEDLEKEIRNTLQDSFNVKIHELTITDHQTKLSSEFFRLQSMIGKIEVSDFARLIHYQINYAVDHVDPESWHIFMIRLSNESAEFKMMAIGETLRNYFETVFNTDPRFRLIHGTHKDFPKLIEAIFKNAQNNIVSAHGLRLQLVGINPIQTEVEINAEQYRKDQLSAKYLNELKSLFTQNNPIKEVGPNENTIESLLIDYKIPASENSNNRMLGTDNDENKPDGDMNDETDNVTT